MKLSGTAEALRLDLEADEQLTFLTDQGAEYDLAVKDWGAYLTPSLRGRLAGFGLRPCLILAADGCRSLAVVELAHVTEFLAEMAARDARPFWLDAEDLLATAEEDIP